MVTRPQAETFRRLSIGDQATVYLMLGANDDHLELDARTASFVRLGALIMADPAMPAYQHEIQVAIDAGASHDEVIAVLHSVAPVAGSARLVSAAPKIAMALGYDVDAALEAMPLEGDES